MADFVPHVAQHRLLLATLLKKNHPPCSSTHLATIKSLKEKSKSLPTLQILAQGIRILQTDVSDLYWGAALFKESPKTRICGHKSDAFSTAECHYHSTFKEF